MSLSRAPAGAWAGASGLITVSGTEYGTLAMTPLGTPLHDYPGHATLGTPALAPVLAVARTGARTRLKRVLWAPKGECVTLKVYLKSI